MDNNRSKPSRSRSTGWDSGGFFFETEEESFDRPVKKAQPSDSSQSDSFFDSPAPKQEPKRTPKPIVFDDSEEYVAPVSPSRNRSNVSPAEKSGSKSRVGVILSGVGIALLVVVSFAWTWVNEGLIGRLNIVSENTQSQVVLTDEQQALLNSERDDGTGEEEVDPNAVPDDVIISNEDVDIILLIGCDSRLGGKDASRSDSIMLGVIDRKHQKIKLISILRDIYSTIPGYKKNKFNTAFYYDSMNGNMDLKVTRATIEKNLGVTVDDFVVIDFSAFKKLVDELGGVTMEVNAAEADYMCHDKKYGKFPRYEAGAGVYKMTGAEALNYARMRKIKNGNGDFGRTERQRKLLEQIMTEALQSNRSYIELAGIASEILPYITTNISEQRIYGYMADALNILRYDMVQYTVPIDGTWRYCDVQFSTGSASVVSVNYKFNSSELKKFIFDDDMTYADGKKATGVAVPTITDATSATTSSESSEQTTTTAPAQTTTTTAPPATTTTAAPTTTTTAAA
ncbi:MAG: LytR family transcriptional regulator [Ruminococcaceae bacterium]|nr:LytR family transcriptional regulator [Oscillospiraceae bacterium]